MKTKIASVRSLSISAKKYIYFLDPKHEIIVNDVASERENFLSGLLRRFLSQHLEEENELFACPWNLHRLFDSPRFPHLQNDFDSDIYVFIFAYNAVFECPIVFNDSEVTSALKSVICYKCV